MADVVNRVTRSRMMAGIRPRNTSPERIVRSLLFAQGHRFRLHCADLPGKPDLVFASKKAVVLVHGCFWHMHTGCKYFRMPESRRAFWSSKLHGNQSRDHIVANALTQAGWRVLVVWECATRVPVLWPRLQRFMAQFVDGKTAYREIGLRTTTSGKPTIVVTARPPPREGSQQ